MVPTDEQGGLHCCVASLSLYHTSRTPERATSATSSPTATLAAIVVVGVASLAVWQDASWAPGSIRTVAPYEFAACYCAIACRFRVVPDDTNPSCRAFSAEHCPLFALAVIGKYADRIGASSGIGRRHSRASVLEAIHRRRVGAFNGCLRFRLRRRRLAAIRHDSHHQQKLKNTSLHGNTTICLSYGLRILHYPCAAHL